MVKVLSQVSLKVIDIRQIGTVADGLNNCEQVKVEAALLFGLGRREERD